MKPLKILGLTVMAAAVLMALIGDGTASATVLCKNNSSTTACSETYGSGTEIKSSLVSGTKSKLATPFKTIECSKSSMAGKTSNAGGSSETIKESVETLTFEECNCTVTVLKKGSLEVHAISGTDNGTVTSTGAEVTAICSTIFGTVHCIYATENTDLGTLTGGNPAKLSISVELPRLTTSALCSEQAKWTAEYEVTNPKPLYVAGAGSGGGGPTSTTLATSLSGESKSGEEITVNEGAKVHDTATLSGTNASKATGTVKYKVYADKECKELVTSAGEVTVASGSVPASEEETLEAGRVYYWQAEYSGDTNNLASTSVCGKEVLTVKAKTTLSTTLSAKEVEEPIEGEGITVSEGTGVKDKGILGGVNHATATGTVTYKVYTGNECEELVAVAGEVGVEAGEVPFSEEVELGEGTYYWQVEYSGDALHQAVASVCSLVLHVGFPGFRSNANPAAVVGSPLENQLFEFGVGNRIECTKAKYTGGPINNRYTEALMVDPTYSECTGLGAFEKQEVKPEGCKWELTARTRRPEGGFEDKTFLRCTGALKLRILARNGGEIKCEVTLAEQEAEPVLFENRVEEGLLVVDVLQNLENLTYQVTKTEAGCKLPNKEGVYGGGTLIARFKLEVAGQHLSIG